MGKVANMAVGSGYMWATDVEGGLWQWRTDGTEVTHRSHAHIISFVVVESYVLGIRDDGRILILGGSCTDWIRENLPDYVPGMMELVPAQYGVLTLQDDGTVRDFSTHSSAPEVPAELDDVVSLSAGSAHVLALRRDGSVVGWGNNYYGQTDVPEGVTDVTEIYANRHGSFALLGDGTLRTWGEDSLGMFDVPTLDSPILEFFEGYSAGLALIAGEEPDRLEVSAPVDAVAAGATAEFVVTATGTGPFTYQWFKDGVALVGETGAVLTLANAQVSDIADYTLRIRNALGEALSQSVQLNVTGGNTPPQLRHGWTSTSAWAGTPVTINSTVVGGIPLNHQWFYGGIGDESQPVENGEATTITDSNESSGRLWLRSTNSAGLLNSSEGVLIRWFEEDSGFDDDDEISSTLTGGSLRCRASMEMRRRIRPLLEAGLWLTMPGLPRSQKWCMGWAVTLRLLALPAWGMPSILHRLMGCAGSMLICQI